MSTNSGYATDSGYQTVETEMKNCSPFSRPSNP